ncbi:MAG: GspE/PulE family protein [Burkholderiaceae bacterium]|jgi:type II secretory ATPase GspE/PulE/Tfp pilus assembly ATPase PilB-like protein
MSIEHTLQERLLEKGLSRQQLEMLLRQQKQLLAKGRPMELSDLLLRSRFLSREAIMRLLEQSDAGSVEQAVSSTLLPLSLCAHYKVYPGRLDGKTLFLKAARPLGYSARKALIGACSIPIDSLRIEPVDLFEIQRLISKTDSNDSFAALLERLRFEEVNASLLQSAILALLHEALDQRASDIHLLRKEDPDSWIAYRIDSQLKQMHLVPETVMQAVFTRLKTDAGMDASNQRMAQDGRLSIDYRGRIVDFRMATQPLVDGETIALRALDPAVLPGLDALFPGQPKMMATLDALTRISGKSGGIVIVSGATGAGKSTTQYTMACRFDRDRINVVTVEDPVEYVLPFARQIQLQALLKQKATDLERSILRQDPDVLIFGEIRDADSARAALAFAESGHLVLCTIHANGVAQTVERFLSMVDERSRADALFVLAHYLRLAIHQRLDRRLCACATPVSEIDMLKVDNKLIRFSHGKLKANHGLHKVAGCALCNQTGYRGRVAVHETVVVEDSESRRGAFIEAMMNGAVSRALTSDKSGEGVRFISRANTIQSLMDQGIIDAEVGLSALGYLVLDEAGE